MKEIEIVDKRGPKEKHFLQENGEFRAEMYDENIHYFNNGKFEEIDNTLILEDDHYVNKANENKVLFTAVPKPELMRIEKDNHFISFSLKDYNQFDIVQEESMSKLIGKIKYINVLKNVDICYDLVSSRVKESIYIKDKDSDIDKLVFKIDTDLDLKLENDSIIAMNNDECVFKFEVPFMMDSSGELNINVKYELNKIDNSYELKTILDKEWLSSDIKYPVTIDPTITNYSNANSLIDTYIYSGDTNDIRYDREYLKIGVENINGSNRINRALLKFELPNIGTGSQVIDAQLTLRALPDFSHTHVSSIVNIHRITEDWTESGANWNNMNNKYDLYKYASFRSNRLYYINQSGVVTSVGLMGADLTDLVKKWYESYPNYGILLKLNNEIYTNNEIPMVYSKNNTISGFDPKPLLSVTYRNQSGLEDYMHFESKKLTMGTVYHNIYNGNLVAIFDIGRIKNVQVPVELKLVYNTNDVVLNKNIGYGLGYRLNLSQTIRQSNISGESSYLEYDDENGTLHYFKYNNETNKYEDEDGLNIVISDFANEYVMHDKIGNESIFTKRDGIGYLCQLNDTSGNIIYITYDLNNKITKITDSSNLEVNLNYTSNSIIINSPDEIVTLNYENNNLVSISNYQGVTTILNENNRIKTITDVDMKKVTYEYYNQIPYKIRKITEYGINNGIGNYYTASYDFESTTLENHDGKIKQIVFNNFGNPVSITNIKSETDISDASGMKIEYGEEYPTTNKYKNKLLSNELPIKYVKNYLINSSFESTNLNDIIFSTDNNIGLSLATEYSKSGLQSLKMTCGNIQGTVYKEIALPKGEYYTFSGYFKTDNKPMHILLMYDDVNSNTIINSSELILSSNFERYDITSFYPIDASSNLKIVLTFDELGVYYLDDIQLEKGEVSNNYNMIENSDFSNGLSDWDLYAYDNDNMIDIPTSNVFSITNIGNQNALKIEMNPANSTSISRNYNIKGHAGDSYTISFWYKNSGYISSESMGDGPHNNVLIRFGYTDPNYVGDAYIDLKALNPNDGKWQFFSHKFTAESDFDYIALSIFQYFNANEFYITNINLFNDLRSVKYDYDENGNIILEKNRSNNTIEFKYDKNNQLINETDSNGKQSFYEYDNEITDRIIRGISKEGLATEINYDNNSNPVRILTTNRGTIENLTDGIYSIRAKGTNKCFEIINNCISLIFDIHKHGRWIIEKVIIDNDDYYKIRHSIINNKYLTLNSNTLILSNYQDNNSLFKMTKNENGSYYIKCKNINKYLKCNGDTIIIDDLEENNYNFEFYFETGLVNKFTESDAEYTSDRRYIKSITNTNLQKTKYDVDDITGLVNSITNPKGVITHYEYDTHRRIKKIYSDDYCVDFVYNEYNLLEKIINGNKVYKFEYDEFLNVKTIKNNNNILVTNTYLPNNGQISSVEYGNEDEIQYYYDEFDRIDKIIKMNDEYRYVYDSNGYITKIISTNHLIKYLYDSAKRLCEYNFDKFKAKYTYDSNENLLSIEHKLFDQVHTIENEYNSDNDPVTVTVDNVIINCNYDSLGKMSGYSINDDIYYSYNYVSNGLRDTNIIKSIEINNDKYEYKYDKLNNITHIYHNDVLENKYYYDSQNQIIREDNYLLLHTIRYKYDKFGNILSKKVFKIDTYEQISINKYEYGNPDWEDQLTKFNNELIQYDEIGNPVSIGNSSLTWVNGRQLNNYSDGINTLNFEYDKDGFRISKTYNNTKTYYYLENDEIIFEKSGDNVLYYLRSDIGGLIGFKYNNDIYYYLKNINDDIIGIVDDNNNLIARYTYDTFGNILSITDAFNNDLTQNTNHIANINPFRYRSYYYDKEIQLYYLNNRYYNPLWGRFINADNYISNDTGLLGYNMYVYCNNNFVNVSDDDGHGVGLALFVGGCILAGAFLVNSINKLGKAKKEIKKTQNKKKTQKLKDKTKELNQTMKNNAKELQGMVKNTNTIEKLAIFADNVGDGKRYDLKIQDEWKEPIIYNDIVLEPEDIGNMHYGYIGRAIGIPKVILYAGAGYNQYSKFKEKTVENCFTISFCDDPRDTIFIRMGAIKYDKEH